MCQVMNGPVVAVVIRNRPVLTRLAFLLQSTMVMPPLRKEVLAGEKKISEPQMFEVVVPRLLALWDTATTRLTALESSPGELERLLAPMFAMDIGQCADSAQVMAELDIVARSREMPEVSGALEGALNSMLYLKAQKEFIFDFRNLVDSLRDAHKFQALRDPPP